MTKSPNLIPLNQETYLQAILELSNQDPDLAGVVSKWGNPPFWTHTTGFPGLVLAILAQQVSLESAQAAYTKLEQAINSIRPEKFLTLNDDELRRIGFSRQKASYARGVADGIVTGVFDLAALHSMDDETARKRLIELRGIGPWTADTYLLFSLRRPDAWPSGDLALIKAVQEVRGWGSTPRSEEIDAIAQIWKPWRAVAARILWHHYLCERGRSASV